MIADHVIDEVRARVDLVEIIGEHVALRRAGKDFKGLCPFPPRQEPIVLRDAQQRLLQVLQLWRVR